MLKLLLLGVLGLTPVLTFSQAGSCPSINIIGPPYMSRPGTPLQLSVKIQPTPLRDLVYRWSSDVGTILTQQGNSAVLETTSIDPRTPVIPATIVVKVGGLPDYCLSTAKETLAIGKGIDDPAILDEYPLSLPAMDEAARLDNVEAQVQQNPGTRACIVINTERNAFSEYVIQRVKRIEDWLYKRRKYPQGRFSIFVDNGFSNESVRIILWPIDEPFYCRECEDVTGIDKRPGSS